MNRPLSVTVIKYFLLVWGIICILSFLLYLILGRVWVAVFPGNFLFLFVNFDPTAIMFLGTYYSLSPLIIGMGALMGGFGLYKPSKFSLKVSKLYIFALLVALLPKFILTIPPLASFAYFSVLGLLSEFVYIFIVIYLGFAILRIHNYAKTDYPKNKNVFDKVNRIVFIPLILIVIWIFYSGFIHFQTFQPRDEAGNPVSVKSSKIISESLTSPDGSYTIKVSPNSDTQLIFVVYDNTGKDDLEIAESIKKEFIGDNKYVGCDCKVSFKGWVNNYTFAIRTIKEDGTEYEDQIDIRQQISLRNSKY